MSSLSRINDRDTCPQCGSDTPQDEGLKRWCDQCNWNLTSPRIAEDQDFLTRKYHQLGERRGRKMLAKLLATPAADLQPRLSSDKVAAFAIAGGIHLLSLAIFITGLFVAFSGYPNLRPLVIGALCVGLAWLLLPRPISVPKKTIALDAFPAFKAFIDQIAIELGGAPVKHVVINEDFNASYVVAGWRREPVLQIGLPLWIALAPQERVAITAHEIAHGYNGDSTRGFVIGSALGALDEWIGLLRPRHRAVTMSEVLASYVTRVLSLPLVALQGLLFHLLWQEKQRSEYFADYLAASIAGTPATVGLLSRVALEEHLEDVLLRHAYSSAQSGSYILGLFRQRIETLPDREWERMRRGSEAEGAQLDSSHPPTAFRVAFLEAHTIAEPKLIVSAATVAAIDAEFRPLEEKLGRKLISRFARD